MVDAPTLSKRGKKNRLQIWEIALFRGHEKINPEVIEKSDAGSRKEEEEEEEEEIDN